MGKIVRKNLMLDAEALATLAQIRGKSESAVVRELVEEALGFKQMADEMMEIMERIWSREPPIDVFGKLDLERQQIEREEAERREREEAEHAAGAAAP